MCLLTTSIPIYYCYLISFFIFGCAELSLPPPFSLAAASGISSLVARAPGCGSSSCCRVWALGAWDSVAVARGPRGCCLGSVVMSGSVVVVQGLSRYTASEILPDQWPNPWRLHWQVDLNQLTTGDESVCFLKLENQELRKERLPPHSGERDDGVELGPVIAQLHSVLECRCTCCSDLSRDLGRHAVKLGLSLQLPAARAVVLLVFCFFPPLSVNGSQEPKGCQYTWPFFFIFLYHNIIYYVNFLQYKQKKYRNAI